jgi:hypothetical protein
MGFWFNNFQEFEKKKKEANRLILNFYYCPDEGEEPQSVKVLVPHNIEVPTNFIYKDKADQLETKLEQHPYLSHYPFELREFGDFRVGKITMPYETRLIKKLPAAFQKGSYDRKLRLGGFFPDRKVTLSPELEQRFNSEEVIELENLDEIKFKSGLPEFLGDSISEDDEYDPVPDFPNSDELSALPSLVLDIEKPFWKKEWEKEILEKIYPLRKQEARYLRKKKKTADDKRLHANRAARIRRLEKKLMYECDGVGEVCMADDQYDSQISSITTTWRRSGQKIDEVYILDPNNEFIDDEFKEWGGFKVIRFATEEELEEAFKASAHQRKPAISYGQNQTYDITQIRYAAEAYKHKFDPAVQDVQPKRDFIKKSLQRLRQDWIYLDTLFMNQSFKPYLRQKSHGTSLKLESLAKSYGIPFKKSLTHEELRDEELRRISGETSEIRKQAMRNMLDYAIDDVIVTDGILEKMEFMPFLATMKQVLPFQTLSEIAFSQNSIQKLHDYIHFSEKGNLPYQGYKGKEREDKLQIFKKRFPVLKRDNFKAATEPWKIFTASKGEYQDVSQFYLPLEDWTRDLAFDIWPKLRFAHNELDINGDTKMADFQYRKEFLKSVFADYYFASREEKTNDFMVKWLELAENENQASNLAWQEFQPIINNVKYDDKTNLVGSWRFLKNHFRSIYSRLGGEARRFIQPTVSNKEEVYFPGIMEQDCDLYMLKERADLIKQLLPRASAERTLNGFLTNFENFENKVKEVAETAFGNSDERSEDLVLAFVQNQRAMKAAKTFYAKYGTDMREVRRMISDGYRNFAKTLSESQGKFLEYKNDYIYVQGATEIPGALLVRKFDTYEVK